MSDNDYRVFVFPVTGVERVVRAFDEDFGPLNETGHEERGDHAEQHFLDKGGVHPPFVLEQKECHWGGLAS
jgi:hypothetical protein